MKSPIVYFGMVFFLFFSIAQAQPDSCEIIKRIDRDIQKRPAEFQHQAFIWQRIHWLQANLGAAQRNVQHPTEYTWICPSHPASFVKMTVDKRGRIIATEGRYSGRLGAGYFSERVQSATAQIQYPKVPFSNFQRPASVVLPTEKLQVQNTNEVNKLFARISVKDDVEAANDQAVKDFKDWFNMTVPKDKIKLVASKMVFAYYQKLKQCMPGHYKFPTVNDFSGQRLSDNKLQPMLILTTSTIVGYENGKCVVSMNPEIATNQSACAFTQDSLDYLSEKEIGAGESSTLEPEDLHKLNQILSASCEEVT